MYRSEGQGRPKRSLSTARWLEPESNQTSRMSFSLLNSRAAALGAAGPGGQQLGRRALVPDVGGVLAEQLHDAIQDLAVRERLAALARNRRR